MGFILLDPICTFWGRVLLGKWKDSEEILRNWKEPSVGFFKLFFVLVLLFFLRPSLKDSDATIISFLARYGAVARVVCCG